MQLKRSDMVEYFGEQLDGHTFTTRGWVQRKPRYIRKIVDQKSKYYCIKF
ncbi:MAG: hypothetical protein O4859_09840 [Trichodesmium sp. St18_bin1]|nr:hypothetical protein [Trichodesmium sp. St18_bin1]MDE5116733.1 hypothetical protein [Trichodesmium sp. St2_bin2_1]